MLRGRPRMAHLNFDHAQSKPSGTRAQARAANHVHHAQIMLVAAGMTAMGIVAVAATMMTTLL